MKDEAGSKHKNTGDVLDRSTTCPAMTLKADSHIACRAHAVPMSFPCHAVR